MSTFKIFGFKDFQELEKYLDEKCDKKIIIPIKDIDRDKRHKKYANSMCEEFVKLLSLCSTVWEDKVVYYFKHVFIKDISNQDMENIKNNNILDLKECNRLKLGKKIKYMKNFLKKRRLYDTIL